MEEKQVIISTPFGNFPLGFQRVEIGISDSAFGTKRKVVMEGFNSMTIDGEFCNIVWKVNHYDQTGVVILNPDLNNSRRVITPVSGQNRVTDQGVTINRKAFPEGEIGDRAYQMTFTIGHNEFTFWMSMLEYVPMPKVLALAATILDQFGRFDEIR
jgi:hypothetical protein